MQLTSYAGQKEITLPWVIEIDKELTPGNYRLEFDQGCLEQDLIHSLSMLKESLLSLADTEVGSSGSDAFDSEDSNQIETDDSLQ